MPGCEEFSVQIWTAIFGFLVRLHGPVKYPSLLRIAATSKTFRSRVIDFWNASLSIPRELEAIISDPARFFYPRKAPDSRFPVGILRPRLVSDLAQDPQGPQSQQDPQAWSILRRANSASIVTASAVPDLALLSRLAPNVGALALTFDAPNVSFGTDPLELSVQCLIIDQANSTGRRETRVPVSGTLRCPNLTHLVVTGLSRGLPDFECIEAPALTHLLLGYAPGSFAGIQRLTALRSLVIRDTGNRYRTSDAALRTITQLAHLAQLSTLYISFSFRESFLLFISTALPSLTKLASLTVCTPGGAGDMFLHHAHKARACLTGLEHIGLTKGYMPFASGEADLSWPTPDAMPSTGSDLHALPDSIFLRRLEVHRAFYSSWRSWTGLSAITELCLDDISLAREPEMTALPLTSLSSIWLPRMISLTVLKLSDLQDLSDLSVLAALAAYQAHQALPALSTLVITKCTGLTDAGCACLGSMHSLTELSFTSCGRVTLPSLSELTRLATLSIDLLDNDTDELSEEPSSCFVEIPRTPESLRRLRFHHNSTSATLGRPQIEYMDRLMAEKPHLTELSVSYWDKTCVWGINMALPS